MDQVTSERCRPRMLNHVLYYYTHMPSLCCRSDVEILIYFLFVVDSTARNDIFRTHTTALCQWSILSAKSDCPEFFTCSYCAWLWNWLALPEQDRVAWSKSEALHFTRAVDTYQKIQKYDWHAETKDNVQWVHHVRVVQRTAVQKDYTVVHFSHHHHKSRHEGLWDIFEENLQVRVEFRSWGILT